MTFKLKQGVETRSSMCKRPGLSRNSLLLIMTGEKAKKQGRVERGRGGGQGARVLQGSAGCSQNSVFIFRKIGRIGMILSEGVASDLSFPGISLAASGRRDGWAGKACDGA